MSIPSWEVLFMIQSVSLFLYPHVFAAPRPVQIEERDPQLLSGIVNAVVNAIVPTGVIAPSLVPSIIAGIQSDISAATDAASAYALLLKNIVPTKTPTSIPDVISIAHGALPTATSTSTDLITGAAALIANGIKPGGLGNLVSEGTGFLGAIGFTPSGINSINNNNPRNPSPPIYPKKSPCDAPYSVSETTLRSAIYIPSTFTYGTKPAIVLTPGTGGYGGADFQGNFIKTLQANNFDPVWINIPGAGLGDAQVNSEYTAYAINYISSITGNKNVSLIGWSQGSLNGQWALKYWPSVRNVTTDFIAISGDYHGTFGAYILAPAFPKIPADPSVFQQTATSNFVAALLSNGGDSAYVPTTNVYSAFDEIIQPQSGSAASGALRDDRGVGVTNAQVQAVCPGLPAGGVYTHEGMLFNPITYALAIDALTHPGPGLTGRIDLAKYCNMFAAPGLTLADVLATEGDILICAVNILLYPNKVLNEPPVMAYAAGTGACAT